MATAILLAWYPLAHLYQYQSSIGNIPRVLDGVFGIVAVASFAAFGSLLLFHLAVGGRHSIRGIGIVWFLLFITFFTVAGSWTLFHSLLGGGHVAGAIPFDYYSRVVLGYGMLFVLGYYARVSEFAWLWFAAFLALFVNTITSLRLDYLIIDLREVVDPGYSGLYLSLSDTALFTGLFAWAAIKPALIRVLLLVGLAVVLFLLGSRANFGAYLAVVPLALALTLRPSKQLVTYLILGGVLIFGLAGLSQTGALQASRQAELFNPAAMGSLAARTDLLELGARGIAENPLLGDYAGQLRYGGIGGYIHNWLSVWRAFGVLPFVAFSGLVFGGLLYSVHYVVHRLRRSQPSEQLLVVLLVLCAIEVVAAKPVGWTHIALAWGMLTRQASTDASAVSPRAILGRRMEGAQ